MYDDLQWKNYSLFLSKLFLVWTYLFSTGTGTLCQGTLFAIHGRLTVAVHGDRHPCHRPPDPALGTELNSYVWTMVRKLFQSGTYAHAGDGTLIILNQRAKETPAIERINRGASSPVQIVPLVSHSPAKTEDG